MCIMFGIIFYFPRKFQKSDPIEYIVDKNVTVFQCLLLFRNYLFSLEQPCHHLFQPTIPNLIKRPAIFCLK